MGEESFLLSCAGSPTRYIRNSSGNNGYFSSFRPAHRVFAALRATSRRRSGVMVSNLRLPPILPPLRPIAAMTRDISEVETLGGRTSRLSVPVERRTIWKAAWFTSSGRLDLLIRFGMGTVSHIRQPDQNSK